MIRWKGTKQGWLRNDILRKKVLSFMRFLSLVKSVSIRIVLSLVALLDLELEQEQLDVKISFLHGDLDEEIHMEQPEGFIQNQNKKFVSRLKKSLYGLRKSPRQ
jgi:hypothetical protein